MVRGKIAGSAVTAVTARTVTALTVAALVVAGLADPAVAHASPPRSDPPNMMAVPSQIPEAIDRAIPAPPYPKPRTIPRRAQAPGFDAATLALRNAVLPDPTGDPMFDRWSPTLDDHRPGDLLAVRDVTATAAPLVTAPITRARLVKFRSTDALGQPMFGTATVLEPKTPAPARGPRPILVNNLAIDSLGASCTPGYTLAHGFGVSTNSGDLVPPTTQLALARGYTVIVPDHQGPRMAYAEPTVAGHVILDSIRAAGHLDAARFGESRVAMTGYSGGAIATNGAAKLLGSYAPDLVDRMVGAALGGVPADFRMLVGSMNANLATGLFHAATFGIAREQPDVLTKANHFAQWFATSPLKNACMLPLVLAGATFWPMQLMANDADPFHSPVAERIYRVTKLATKRSDVPLYIYNGAQEFWIPAAGARNLFREQCRLGANATYREVFGEHVIAAVTGYPEALTWLDARLRGIPAANGCPR
ncbi:lipase family protein [Gordonia shandongensis]|uniref:lipase family protein n=1 Tax=Gordonia shandongensis TaxID=376351 RepID=UPI00041CF56E|nr:lipase family protein [Gordonia shandongensis]